MGGVNIFLGIDGTGLTWVVGVITAITIISVFFYKVYNIIKSVIKKNENIDKVPEFTQIIEGVSETTKNNMEAIKQLAEELKKNEEAIKEIQNKIPTYDKYLIITSEMMPKLEKHFDSDEIKCQLILAQARQTLLSEFEISLEYNSISINRRIVLGQLYEAYEDMGGNNVVSSLWEQVQKLPTK